MKYKKGDYIRRTEPPPYPRRGITKGAIYIVAEDMDDDKHVSIINDDGKRDSYFADRFELAEDWLLKKLWQ